MPVDSIRACRAGAMLTLFPMFSACSILSPMPLWELTKGVGAAVGQAVAVAPGEAVNTVYHPHDAFSQLCIEYNPDSPAADVVPAIQAELMSHQVSSRVYESSANVPECQYWLRYSAYLEWGIPFLSGEYQPYISRATLTLSNAQGRVMASSSYRSDSSQLGVSKWAATRAKLAPVVLAVLTGRNSEATTARNDPQKGYTP